MSQRISNSFVNTNRPGSYFDVKVKSTPVGVASSGNIVIIGEAKGGAAIAGIDSSGDSLKDNFFTPDQLDKVVAKYISGPIVDAFRALSSSSSDADITGSANRIYIAKTNQGVQASAVIANAYGSLVDKNFGVDGNKYFYQVTQALSEVAPSITGSAISFTGIAATGTVTITDFSSIAGAVITVEGVAYTEGAEWAAGASNDAAATSLASAINGGVNVGAAAVTNVVTITASVAGVAGNAITTVTSDAVNAAVSGATLSGGDDADGSIFDGLSFSVRQDGGVEEAITLSVGEAAHDTIAELAAEITAQFLASTSIQDMECVVSGTDQLEIRRIAATDTIANAAGHGKSFELVDSSAGDLAAIGHAEAVIVSSQESEIQLDINRQDTGTNEQLAIEAAVAMSVGYEGTSATLSIVGDTLSTVVSGGTGVSLSIDISEFATCKDLADFIGSQTGYTASVESSATQKATSALDKVSAIGIASTESGAAAGRIKRAASNFATKAAESAVVDFSATATQGLPKSMNKPKYLEGGVKGATSAADIVSATDDLEGVNVNFVVPLFSRDAIADIADGLTDSGSTYTIAAINAATKNHVLKMSTAKIKKHRSCFLSFWGTFNESKDQAGSLANARVSMTMQRTSQVDSLGQVVNHMPWHTACVAAGMQAAGFYKAIVNKFANVISFTDPVGFDSGSPGDIETALDAGILFLEKAVVGNKWVSDQTTYGVDTNFVYNSIQAVYAADLVSLDLAESFQVAFVGKSVADVDASVGLAFLATKMDLYKKQKLIAASDDAQLGFKNAKVVINGPIMEVSVEIKLATAIYFIPINIEISQVQSAA